jgi:hypothetical protein
MKDDQRQSRARIWRLRSNMVGCAGLLLTSCEGESSQQSAASSSASAASVDKTVVTSSIAKPDKPFVNLEADFAKVNPDAGVATYVGWPAVAGATGYALRYKLGTDSLATVNNIPLPQPGMQPGWTSPVLLSPNKPLTVQVAAKDTAGQLGAWSDTAQTFLPAGDPSNTLYITAHNYSAAHDGEGILIAKNGVIVYANKEVTKDYIWSYPHILNSGTKSFSCALAKFAQADYPAMNLDNKVQSVITDWSSLGFPINNKNDPNITFRDLLTLQSGRYKNSNWDSNPAGWDTYHVALNSQYLAPRDTVFYYDPVGFQAYALAFQIASGGTYKGNTPGVYVPLPPYSGGLDPNQPGRDPVQYLQDKLFATDTDLGPGTGFGLTPVDPNAPDDPGDYKWNRDGAQTTASHPQMAGGAVFRATAWLKYGQFMLQRGTWKTQRLLPQAATDDCVGNSFGTNGYANNSLLGYGVTFWLNANVDGTYNPPPDGLDQIPASIAGKLGPNGVGPQNIFDPELDTTIFSAAGGGYERLYVIPSKNLVVVRFGATTQGDDAEPNGARAATTNCQATGGLFDDGCFLTALLGT